ncbi:hypothetical protein [Bradyrhizobium stylosanthis]|uniref:DUF992 domain-containing protein n=1 Tax=Bradyrhizobium stylosanthis TaxID=1803665 RepID=A0A560DGJ2_9BRAD|nr:hypothetical protein [Bradyrhizobium stylosanthis]TWA96192.1 hypothetical protein FBZ96_107386 [Bradyrhizobium stylosanthis]
MSRNRLAIALACSVLGLSGASGLVLADTIGRYECNVVGSAAPEPLGDRAGHGVANYQYSCIGVDGLLKGAVLSATNISEWDGPQGKFLLGGGVHRTADGAAVSRLQEGTSSMTIKDGKPVASTGSGTAIFNLGSGTLSALSGKTAKFKSKSTGYGRFELEFED